MSSEIDSNVSLFSLAHHQALADQRTNAERTARAEEKRIIARLILEARVRAGQDKVVRLEDRQAGLSVGATRRAASRWRQMLETIGLVKATMVPESPLPAPGSIGPVEVARQQLARLLSVDGPVALHYADIVAEAITSAKEPLLPEPAVAPEETPTLDRAPPASPIAAAPPVPAPVEEVPAAPPPVPPSPKPRSRRAPKAKE